LEENGLVARTSDPTDRRSSLITTTPEGRDLMRTLRTRKDAYLARRLTKLTADERETLARAAELLERLLEEDEA
jgi:DNA-binding MarR family transcriptional regulator